MPWILPLGVSPLVLKSAWASSQSTRSFLPVSRQGRATALIERYYAAFNAGDWDGMVALLHEDVVHDLNQGARESGRAAFRAFLDRMARSYAERLREIVVMASDDGTRAAAEYVVHGEYRVGEEGLPPARGQRYVLPGGAFFAIRDDRIARVSNYYNLHRAEGDAAAPRHALGDLPDRRPVERVQGGGGVPAAVGAVGDESLGPPAEADDAVLVPGADLEGVGSGDVERHHAVE